VSKSPNFDFFDQSFAHRSRQMAKGQLHDRPAQRQVLHLPKRAPGKAHQVEPAGLNPPMATDPMQTRSLRIVVRGREFVIAGNVVSCACPDCGAPMSVRVWLAIAECWRCQCSISLDRFENDAIAAALQSGQLPLNQPKKWEDFLLVTASPVDGLPTVIAADELPRLDRERLFLGWLPAWLVSFLLHVLLIVLLALIMFSPNSRDARRWDEPLELVLSPFVNELHEEGGIVRVESPESEADNPVLRPGPEPDDRRERENIEAARELKSDPSPAVELSALDVVRRSISNDGGSKAALAARDPRIRDEIVFREGGTTETEAAVARGLRWLASVQNRDGSWSLSNYSRHANPRNEGDAAATGLALLPFLGAGQTQEYGIYKQTVARGIMWLLENQEEDGDLRANFPGQAGMYAHGQCSIVLCEAYAMTGDERLRRPAQKAIDFIAESQHKDGGWRYYPGQAGDTSVFGWQLMALQSARETGTLQIASGTMDRAGDYLARAGSVRRGDPFTESGVLYRYQPGEGDIKASMTAEAMLCRMYLGWKRDDPRVMRSIKWLVRNHSPDSGAPDVYYWYYATQAIHHYGGQEWTTWNNSLREILVDLQEKRGNNLGSWEPRQFDWGAQGGRIFTTSFAVCTLEVYYRRLPLFRNLDLESPPNE